MKRFSVLIHAKNVVLMSDDGPRVGGFYRLVHLDAVDENEAANFAKKMIMEDENEELLEEIFNEEGNPVVLYAEEVEEVLQDDETQDSLYVLYIDEED